MNGSDALAIIVEFLTGLQRMVILVVTLDC
jgi:hypothetical protein